MSLAAFLLAGAAAAIVSSTELWFKHGRHPFGHSERWATAWWALILIADVFAVLLILIGALVAPGIDDLDDLGWLSWIAVGILGPLGLRSPVRKARVGDKEEEVGLTEYYDRLRIGLDRQLDDRIARLRRRDRDRVADALREHKWDANALCGAIELHLEDLRSRDQQELDAVRARLRVAMSAPTPSERLDGVIKVMFDERFRSVIGDVQSRSPRPSETQAGSGSRLGGTTSRTAER